MGFELLYEIIMHIKHENDNSDDERKKNHGIDLYFQNIIEIYRNIERSTIQQYYSVKQYKYLEKIYKKIDSCKELHTDGKIFHELKDTDFLGGFFG